MALSQMNEHYEWTEIPRVMKSLGRNCRHVPEVQLNIQAHDLTTCTLTSVNEIQSVGYSFSRQSESVRVIIKDDETDLPVLLFWKSVLELSFGRQRYSILEEKVTEAIETLVKEYEPLWDRSRVVEVFSDCLQVSRYQGNVWVFVAVFLMFFYIFGESFGDGRNHRVISDFSYFSDETRFWRRTTARSRTVVPRRCFFTLFFFTDCLSIR